MKEESDVLFVPLLVYNVSINDHWKSQGYRFFLIDMHGKPRSNSTYSGRYESPSTWVRTSQTSYDYFEPDETVPVFNGVGSIGDDYLGRETEVVFEGRELSDITIDASAEVDLGVSLFFLPIPWGSLWPTVDRNQTRIYTHATTKIIRQPVFLKSVTTYVDGITKYVENIAFDPQTGQAVMTRGTDGFNAQSLQLSPSHVGWYTSYSFSAAGEYTSMGQRAVHEHRRIMSDSLIKIERRLISPYNIYLNLEGLVPGALASVPSLFTAGDQVMLNRKSDGNLIGIYTVSHIDRNHVYLLPVSFNYPLTSGVEEVHVEIIRSGMSNQLGSGVGSITTYGIPQTPVLCPE